MMATVSCLRSPPFALVAECIAINSLSSMIVRRSSQQRSHNYDEERTSTSVNDSVLGAQYELQEFGNRPCDYPLVKMYEYMEMET